ncbi:MAG: hypothetical protein R2705_00650 [Ilumatobacteraceae bacterium]
MTEAVSARPVGAQFVLEWLDPPFGSGHWVPEMVQLAGGTPVVSRPHERSVATT